MSGRYLMNSPALKLLTMQLFRSDLARLSVHFSSCSSSSRSYMYIDPALRESMNPSNSLSRYHKQHLHTGRVDLMYIFGNPNAAPFLEIRRLAPR